MGDEWPTGLGLRQGFLSQSIFLFFAQQHRYFGGAASSGIHRIRR
jgi:hypothetical protein